VERPQRATAHTGGMTLFDPATIAVAHGSGAGYRRGCRCPKCQVAHSQRVRAQRRRRQLVGGAPLVGDTAMRPPGPPILGAAQEPLPTTPVRTAAEVAEPGAGWSASATLLVGLVIFLAVIALVRWRGEQGPQPPPQSPPWRRRW